MSTTDLRKGSVRVALGDLLHAAWDPSNAADYDPNLAEGDPKHLNISLGTYSEDSPVPHISLRGVSELPSTPSGYSAIKADGTGAIQTFNGRIDLKIHVGAQGDLPEHPQLLAKRIGLEAREIVHDNAQGVMDSATGELLVSEVACSRPTVSPDSDLPGPEFVGRCEVTYKLDEDPPDRA